jgi:hypothetical protein
MTDDTAHRGGLDFDALSAGADRVPLETSDALYEIGVKLARAAGALAERDHRIDKFARFRVGDGPAEHGLVGLLDELLGVVGRLPGGDRRVLRAEVQAEQDRCNALRGSEYSAHFVGVFAAAADAALTFAQALPTSEMAQRQELLKIVALLASCAERDAADYLTYI